jgi:hypothetical protein
MKKRSWAKVLFSVLLILCGQGPVDACSGIFPDSPQQAFQQSTSVFSGTVLSVGAKQNDPQYAFGYYEATVAVDRWWKGGDTSQMKVRFDESTCGAFLKPGQWGVIFAQGNPPFTSALSGNLMRTRLARPDRVFESEYGRLKKQLGRGKLPQKRGK